MEKYKIKIGAEALIFIEIDDPSRLVLFTSLLKELGARQTDKKLFRIDLDKKSAIFERFENQMPLLDHEHLYLLWSENGNIEMLAFVAVNREGGIRIKSDNSTTKLSE